MSIEGRIAIDVNFADSSDATGVQSLKKISLVDTSSYSSGKVVIVTGTCGTATVNISVAPSAYRDASGSLVSLASVQRIAFSATPAANVDTGRRFNGGDNVLTSRNGQVSVVDVPSVSFVYTTAGTASYTLVLYGT
jgi:hypothetical protein